jgi:hypothetical protein
MYKINIADLITNIKLDKDLRNREEWSIEFNLKTKIFGDLLDVIHGRTTINELLASKVQARRSNPRRGNNNNNNQAEAENQNESTNLMTPAQFETLKGDFIRVAMMSISTNLFKDVTKDRAYATLNNNNDFVGIFHLISEKYALSAEEHFDESVKFMDKILNVEFSNGINIDNLFNDLEDNVRKSGLGIPDDTLLYIVVALMFYKDDAKVVNDMYDFCKEYMVKKYKEDTPVIFNDFKMKVKSYYKQINRHNSNDVSNLLSSSGNPVALITTTSRKFERRYCTRCAKVDPSNAKRVTSHNAEFCQRVNADGSLKENPKKRTNMGEGGAFTKRSNNSQ